MNYEEAQAILLRLVNCLPSSSNEMGTGHLSLSEIMAISKGLQAVGDCLELGLNGIGD